MFRSRIGLARRLLACTFISVSALLCCTAWPSPAVAGMPMMVPDESTRRVFLTDAGRYRYEAISFFLVMLLLSALAVRLLWNYLARDFTWLPRISFGKSLGVVATWGLLVLVVLTMIAAAREMMTPGSWKKQGLLYTLADPPAARARCEGDNRQRCDENERGSSQGS